MNQRKKQKATKDFKTAFVRLIVFPYEHMASRKDHIKTTFHSPRKGPPHQRHLAAATGTSSTFAAETLSVTDSVDRWHSGTHVIPYNVITT